MFHCKPPGLIGATRAGFGSVKSKARLSSANADAHTLWGCLAASPMSFDECPRDRRAHETPHVEATQRHPAYLATAEELRVRVGEREGRYG